MPIVTVTMRKGRAAGFKTAVLDAMHGALVSSGADPRDRFQRVIELSEDDFRFDPSFPDLTVPRSTDFVLIEVLLGVGRSVKVKRAILAEAARRLTASGIDPEHVMVVFQDVPWENFSPAGGRLPHG